MAWTADVGYPPAWFVGWTSNGTNITLPIASMSQLTAAEAAAADGDIRQVMYAVMENMWSKWNGVSVANRPTKMTISKSSSVDSTTGVITAVYTMTFKNAVTAQDVAAE